MRRHIGTLGRRADFTVRGGAFRPAVMVVSAVLSMALASCDTLRRDHADHASPQSAGGGARAIDFGMDEPTDSAGASSQAMVEDWPEAFEGGASSSPAAPSARGVIQIETVRSRQLVRMSPDGDVSTMHALEQGMSEAFGDARAQPSAMEPAPPGAIWRVASTSGDAPSAGGVVRPGTGVFVERAAGAPGMGGAIDDVVTLNLIEAPIPEAIERIIGDVLGASFVIDDSVTGTITVQTASPVAPADLFTILEAALDAKGFVILREADFYHVVQRDAASLGGTTSVDFGGVGVGGVTGGGVRVFPLRHISAAEMARILQPLTRDDAIVNIDAERNLIMLQGTGRELNNFEETIALFDVDWLRGMSFALFPLDASDADDMVLELQEIFATNEGRAGEGLVRFMPIRRLNAVLAISPQSSYIRRVEDWVWQLDRLPAGQDRQVFVYDVQNRTAVDLAEVLVNVFGGGGNVSRTDGFEGGVAPAFEELTLTSADGSAGVTPAVADRASVVNGREAAGASGGGAGPADIDVYADDANNALIIYATAEDYDRALKVIERLDRIPNQVLLEATIAEVRLQDDLDFGLQWFFSREKSDISFSRALNGSVASTFPGFSYLFSTDNIRIALDAVSSLTDVKILSAPTLMVLDNKTATLKVGDEVPIATSESRSVNAGDTPIVNTISYRDTGVLLKITPRVNEGGLVVLDIEQEVSEAVDTTTSGLEAPTVTQRQIQTSVAVQSGESLALGGLISETNGTTSVGVPIVSRVPVLGALFRSSGDRRGRTELLVIITPRVVRNVAEARAVTDELRERLTILRNGSSEWEPMTDQEFAPDGL